jgi:Lytic transglycolase
VKNFDRFGGGANPNNAAACQTCATVQSSSGKMIYLQIVDKCEGCKDADVDMTPTAFEKLADLSQGRIRIDVTFEQCNPQKYANINGVQLPIPLPAGTGNTAQAVPTVPTTPMLPSPPMLTTPPLVPQNSLTMQSNPYSVGPSQVLPTMLQSSSVALYPLQTVFFTVLLAVVFYQN